MYKFCFQYTSNFIISNYINVITEIILVPGYKICDTTVKKDSYLRFAEVADAYYISQLKD